MTVRTQRTIIAIVGLSILAIGTVFWIMNPTSSFFPPILTAIGIAISFLAWIFPSLPVNLLELVPLPSIQYELKLHSTFGMTNKEKGNMEDLKYSTADCDAFSEQLEKKLTGQVGALVIFKDEEDDGLEVYLLPLSDWDSSGDYNQRNNHSNKQTTYFRRRKIHLGHAPIYVADFLELKPNNYKIWMSESKMRNVTIRSGEATTIDWRSKTRKKFADGLRAPS